MKPGLERTGFGSALLFMYNSIVESHRLTPIKGELKRKPLSDSDVFFVDYVLCEPSGATANEGVTFYFTYGGIPREEGDTFPLRLGVVVHLKDKLKPVKPLMGRF